MAGRPLPLWRVVAATAFLPAVLAGCARAPEGAAVTADPRACFWSSEVTGFTAAGPGRAILNVGSRRSWELTLSPGCPDIDWALQIAIRARGGERVCAGRPAELVVPDASGSPVRTCLIRTIRPLPPQR
ncbi:MAG: DUF6491 family protein [Pseudomonadota bacterium]